MKHELIKGKRELVEIESYGSAFHIKKEETNNQLLSTHSEISVITRETITATFSTTLLNNADMLVWTSTPRWLDEGCLDLVTETSALDNFLRFAGCMKLLTIDK